ncbi:MAG TPA: hypothetical protein VFW94_18715, partial [Candidatus Acidoferrales bacterium]|nr:hypothetical protein [Candidatus Acidoferrales bacterium]
MKRRVIPFLAAGFATVLLGANQEETQRLQASADVLQQVMGTPDKGIPSNLFHRAYCVIVIPG